ncbi:CBF1 INTERACTING COREPRESSOR CIR [Salix viminalis]|uniref:CBF1 INTERACTING COREPRESSOR CIR n=1 Tax=Salix viminalis TaxID=40686 RepID=A0A9Q0TPW0_SALVM|nr:CBF1 INTERACTING COREPRESSOR CIR [Salix viminalis]
MEGEEGGGIRLSKRFDDYNKKSGGGGGGGGDEVDYKNKSGTAWSHSYLNQKPWHPLSYPNQRRKWIAEQTHAQRERRTEEVAREYAQEQEFFRQTALISKKEKEKIEMMKAVSFMYVRPPGYNAESAKAAEIADASQPPAAAASSSSNSMHPEAVAGDHKKKPRPKDAFGRPLPTQEEFQVLTNAPRLETGVPARVKPFGIEVRNVKCLRCGKYGHQSGDRECPLKDVIMPNEESRLKRDDPLTAIVAQTDPSEPLKWELKQKPGISPPRGGFNPDDPNQQIVAEDIFDEYGVVVISLIYSLTSLQVIGKRSRKGVSMKKEPSPSREIWEENGLSSPSNKEEKRSNEEKKRKKKKRLDHSESSSSEDFMFDRHPKRNKHRHSYSSEVSDSDKILRNIKSKKKHYHSSESDSDRCRSKSSRKKDSYSTVHFHSERRHRSGRDKQSYSHLSTDSKSDRQRRGENHSRRHFHRSDS